MIVQTAEFSPQRAPTGFIVLEGVNGAGKTTLLKALAAHLSERLSSSCTDGHPPVICTREPGSGAFGAKIRSLVLQAENRPHSSFAEMFLFAADRAEHVHRLIAPSLAQQQVVLSDRYFYSTEAFQGYGRGIPLDEIRQINRIAIQQTVPDVVLLLDLPAELGLKRNRAEKGREQDSFEAEELEFHQRLREGFLSIAAESEQPFLVLDATLPAAQLQESALEKLAPYFDSLVRERQK